MNNVTIGLNWQRAKMKLNREYKGYKNINDLRKSLKNGFNQDDRKDMIKLLKRLAKK